MKAGGSIAVIGGGFSGVALTLALLDRGARVILIERSGDPGPGLAYGTRCGRHLLNVRSGRMSLKPDQPEDFIEWLQGQDPTASAEGFARRSDYGRYVRDRLAEGVRRGAGRLVTETAEVVEAQPEAAGVTIRLADGRELRAEAAVLATGNAPPSALTIPGLEAAGEAYAPDPWAPGALEGLGPEQDVFLVGAGLTAVDVLLALEAGGWRGRATAVSRRGLLPRTHGPRSVDGDGEAPEPLPLSQRLRRVRRAARSEPWTEVLDRMRGQHQPLWRQAEERERRRFLRHLRPWWDVHRHRMAPEIGAQVERWIAEGRLFVRGGRPLRVEAVGDGLEVAWRPRGGGELERTPAARVINCTGPEGDPSRADQPVIARLLASGAARTDPLRLGLDTDAQGRIISAAGRPQPRLWALGPPTRGALWEIVAVPEIREQAQATAERLVGNGTRAGPLEAFTAHPREQGETYGQHLGVAFRFGVRLLGAGAAAMIHGITPFLFQKTASRTVTRLHAEMVAMRRCPPRPPKPPA